jgi:formylglycine-generating enzyme required for sulfatase activity/serine/threonine protein kinase
MSDPSTSTSTLVGSLAPGTLLHEYRIERVLGHGGFGITYLARDTHLDKKVAIKEYLPNDLAARAPDQTVTVRSPESSEAFKWGLESFIKEARVLAKFSHPSLIQVHRYFVANETAYFVMEYAEGVTLSTVLKHEGTLTEERLRKILFPILNGLGEVHRLGVLHRDIKPENIILREGAGPVLIDFGAARQNLSSMTRSVMSVLTAGYAPIEQYASGSNQGPWTDLYAIGAVAYRALSGKKPTDAVNRIRDDPLVPAERLGQGRYTPHFLAAIDWALAVSGEDRPQNIGDFKLALDGAITPPPVVRTPRSERADLTPVPTVFTPDLSEAHTVITRLNPPPAKAPAWRTPAAIAAVAVVVAGAVAAYMLTRPKPAETVTAPPAISPQAEPAPPSTATPAAPAPSTATPEAAPPVARAPAPAAPEPKAEPKAEPKEKPKAPPVAAKPAPAPIEESPAPPPSKVTPVALMSSGFAFQDCPRCPRMVALAPASFQMGAQAADNGNKWEGPAHVVNLAKAFAIGRYEVTVGEWQSCVTAKACNAAAPGPVTGDAAHAPVVNVNWGDAQAYVAWLSRTTGRRYRLPSEAEWEYAVRAGTTTARYWGGDRTQQCKYGNGADQSALAREASLQAVECNDAYPTLAPVGMFEPNAFGLHDMAGNAWEWTQDCWRDTYQGAPRDGSALELPSCAQRVIRGGSWRARPNSLRSFGRGNTPVAIRSEDLGLRVVAE